MADGNPIQRLMAAAWSGDLAAIRSILQTDASLVNAPGDAEDSRPIHYAAANSLMTVKELLAFGADPLICGNDGTALHLAVWFNRQDIVAFLLSLNVDANATASAGETPLHFAAFRGYTEIGKLLLQCGAKPNAQTTHGPTDMFSGSPPVVGETPLHLAAAYGHADFTELLLAHGANKNALDRVGQTPRHWAARHGREEIVKLLG